MTDKTKAFRLITEGDVQTAKATGLIPLVQVDKADGFVHLSPKSQVLNTAGLYFSQDTVLFALEFDAVGLGEKLKWERDANRADIFPHLYSSELKWEKATWLHSITWSDSGHATWGVSQRIDEL